MWSEIVGTPSLRLCDLETQEEPGKVISSAFKGQGFTEQIQKRRLSQNKPGKNKWIFKYWGEMDRKWKRCKHYRKASTQLGGEQACHFLESRSCRADCCLPRGAVPPKDRPALALPRLQRASFATAEIFHQLAFILRETISKLIIWIFLPALSFQHYFALIRSLKHFYVLTELASLCSWGKVCENIYFRKSAN